MILQENVAKLPLWQILCLCMKNYVLNCIQWIRILGVVLKNYKTHMVVMEVLSQHLDSYKSKGLISKFAWNSVRTDLSILSCMIFSKSWFYDFALKMIWNLLDIQRSGSVKFHEDWMCLDSPFVFYKWDICCWNEQ